MSRKDDFIVDVADVVRERDEAQKAYCKAADERDAWKKNYEDLVQHDDETVVALNAAIDRANAAENQLRLLREDIAHGYIAPIYTAENGFSKPSQKAAPVIHFDIPLADFLNWMAHDQKEQPPQE